jgi:hypothetical protein
MGEQEPNSLWRSVELPIESEGFICISQVKKTEEYATSRKDGTVNWERLKKRTGVSDW